MKKAKDQKAHKAKETEAEKVELNEAEQTAIQDQAAETGAGTLEAEIAELQSENSALKADLAEMNEAKLRLAAEYDNFRKRSRQEKDDIYTKSVSDVCESWLTVLDNLDRAVQSFSGIENEEARKASEGVEMVLRQAKEIMTKLGVEEIVALGATFDPNLHEAVMHEEDDSKAAQEITEVFQKGYKRGDYVLRHSVVRVVN